MVIVGRSLQVLLPVQPTGTTKFTSSCDVAKQVLAAGSVSYETEEAAAGTAVMIRIGATEISFVLLKGLSLKTPRPRTVRSRRLWLQNWPGWLSHQGRPAKMNKVMMVVILTYLVLLVTMVYGPIAAMLVELFPTRIRYTSMSLPHHIGNGWFGGLLPTMSFAIVAQTGNILQRSLVPHHHRWCDGRDRHAVRCPKPGSRHLRRRLMPGADAAIYAASHQRPARFVLCRSFICLSTSGLQQCGNKASLRYFLRWKSCFLRGGKRITPSRERANNLQANAVQKHYPRT